MDAIINKIETLLNLFKLNIASQNTNSYFDINKYAEYLFIPLLNIVYSCDLIHTDLVRNNFPMIDLVDEKKGYVFQLSSRIDKEKIITTLNSKDNKMLLDFSFFFFLDIKEERKKRKIESFNSVVNNFRKINNISCKIEIIYISDLVNALRTNYFNSSEEWSDKVYRILNHFRDLLEPGYNARRLYLNYRQLFFEPNNKIGFPSEADITENNIWSIKCVDFFYNKILNDTPFLILTGSEGRGKTTALKCIAYRLRKEHSFHIYYFDLAGNSEEMDELGFKNIMAKEIDHPCLILFDNCENNFEKFESLVFLIKAYIKDGSEKVKFIFSCRKTNHKLNFNSMENAFEFIPSSHDIVSIIESNISSPQSQMIIKQKMLVNHKNYYTNLRYLSHLISIANNSENHGKLVEKSDSAITAQLIENYLTHVEILSDRAEFKKYLLKMASLSYFELQDFEEVTRHGKILTRLFNAGLLDFNFERNGFRFIHLEDARILLLNTSEEDRSNAIGSLILDKLNQCDANKLTELSLKNIIKTIKFILLEKKESVILSDFEENLKTWVFSNKQKSDFLFVKDLDLLIYFYLMLSKASSLETINTLQSDIEIHFNDFIEINKKELLLNPQKLTNWVVSSKLDKVMGINYFILRNFKITDVEAKVLMDGIIAQRLHRSNHDRYRNLIKYLKNQHSFIFQNHKLANWASGLTKRIKNQEPFESHKTVVKFGSSDIIRFRKEEGEVEKYLQNLNKWIEKGFVFSRVRISDLGAFLDIIFKLRNEIDYKNIIEKLYEEALDFVSKNATMIVQNTNIREMSYIVRWFKAFDYEGLVLPFLSNPILKNYLINFIDNFNPKIQDQIYCMNRIFCIDEQLQKAFDRRFENIDLTDKEKLIIFYENSIKLHGKQDWESTSFLYKLKYYYEIWEVSN